MMKLFTYRPIAFLLSILADRFVSINGKDGFTVISISNKNLSLIGDLIDRLKRQQKRIGLHFTEKISKNILQYILVGKDKSVVIIRKMITPTVNMAPGYCG